MTCFGLGLLLGFVGAGGAGLAVALLTSVFRLPVHQAIGTALAAMCFVTVAGAYSHYREGNVAPRVGLVVGSAGMIGAVVGANIGQGVPEAGLKLAAGWSLWVLAGLVWLRTRYADRVIEAASDLRTSADRQLAASVGLGLTGGAASAFLGVGMAPFLQLGLLAVLKLPLRQTVGTTMLTLVFISFSGSVSLALYGDVSVPHVIGTTVGLASGSFLGARYTRRARREVLRFAVVATPFLAGSMLIFL